MSVLTSNPLNLGRAVHPLVHPDVATAEKYGLKPMMYHGFIGGILKYTTKHGSDIYEAREKYKNKKYIVFPPLPYNANVNDIIDPITGQIPEDKLSKLNKKILKALSHAYGKPENFGEVNLDNNSQKFITSFSHPTSRIPLGRLISFKVFDRNEAHSIAEITRGNKKEFFNSGYAPTEEESKIYNIPRTSHDIQYLNDCGLFSGLRLAESESTDAELIAKMQRTMKCKNIRIPDVVPVRLIDSIDLKRLEKSDTPQPDMYKKGGIVKKRKQVKSK